MGVEQVVVTSEQRSTREKRPAADVFARRLLFIPEGPASASDDSAHRIFNVSIAISALRCLLSYVVFPILAPLLGAATGVAPLIGIPVALVALFFDAVGIRRFWLADHRWRWAMTGIYATVMCMVTALLAADISHLVK